MGLIEPIGEEKYLIVMRADGSGVSDILFKPANLQTETGQAVMVSSSDHTHLKQAAFSEYASDQEIDSDKAEQAENVRQNNGKVVVTRERNPRSLVDIENHPYKINGKIRVQKVI